MCSPPSSLRGQSQAGAGLRLALVMALLGSASCAGEAGPAAPEGTGGPGGAPEIEDPAQGPEDDSAASAAGSLGLGDVTGDVTGDGTVLEGAVEPVAGALATDPEEWVPLDRWLDQTVVTTREFYPTGPLERIRTVLPSVEGPEGYHGPEMVFHSNGLIKLVKTWTYGQPEGHFRTWFPTGQVKRQGSFAAGELDGEYVEYKKSGSKSFEGSYVHGQLHGRVVEYSQGERPKDESHWEFGRRVGAHRTWSLREVLTLEEHFEDDELHGVYRSFYPEDGKPRVEGTYEQGLRSGYWRGYDEEGRLGLEEVYVAGERHGTRKAFLEGRPLESSEYQNGVLHGTQELFYEDGAKRSAGELKAGKRVGPWFFWNPDGSAIAELTGVYEDDRRVAALNESND